MALTGAPLLVLLGAAAVLLPVVTMLAWNRVRGPGWGRAGQRWALIGLSQAAAVLTAGLLVNHQFSLYDSWADLFGQNPAVGAPVPVAATSAARGARPAASRIPGIGPLPAATDGGRLVEEVVTGPASGIRDTVWVLLPAGYADPANAARRYPVIEFLPGYPGTPTTWLHALQLRQVADRQVAAGQAEPFIGVLPTMNVAMPRDTECTDIPHGLQVATWLGSDVPRIVAQQTRATPLGGWGITGYSTGGFCTAKLLLRYPSVFAAGAVLAGYYTASTDATTGDLFGASQSLRDANDPTWLVTHRKPPAVHLLAVYSAGDPESELPTQRFLSAVRPPLAVDRLRIPTGGHNTGVWLSVEPQVLTWLTRHAR